VGITSPSEIEFITDSEDSKKLALKIKDKLAE
jgi:hypothetical protein